MNQYTIIYMLSGTGPAYPITKAINFNSELDLLGALDWASTNIAKANPAVDEIILVSIKLDNPPSMLGDSHV